MDTMGRNKEKIKEYIKNQLEQDQIEDQIFIDPFTSSKNPKV